ncbi:MAG: helix-turn-helix domain-containing protein [Lachnospiraceae bacterium]
MQNGNLVAEGNGCKVIQFRNENGDGTMTFYDVFPGIGLIYNDFHMSGYQSEYRPDAEQFCIDHCREGRLEYPAKNDAYSYVEAGDLKFDCRLSHTGKFEMPLSHYHGITVAIDLNKAEKYLQEEGKGFPVDLRKLREKFCKDGHTTVIHDACSIEHIFGELYHVPEKIKIPYFKIKILELFLYLYALELPDSPKEKPYFYRTQVEKTKAIKQFLTEHLQEHVTQAELAKRFDLPITAMKQCFKSIYGMPIGSWMLQYRMNYAAEVLLANREISIAELAGEVGYDSPSKFAIAFRKVMGMSPTEYRSRKIPDQFHV